MRSPLSSMRPAAPAERRRRLLFCRAADFLRPPPRPPPRLGDGTRSSVWSG